MMYRIIVLALGAAFAGRAMAQGTCPSGRRVPDLGYGFASCHDCISVIIRNGAHIPRFTGEPALYQIRTDGPAAGRLSEGDTLIDVDGLAITTEAAALRLAEFRPGTMRLTVRRNGSWRTVAINPQPVCVGGIPESTARSADSVARVRAQQQYAIGVISRAEFERAMGRHEVADSLARVNAEQAYRVGAMSREAYERAMGRYDAADSIARDNARQQYHVGMITREDYERIVGAPPQDAERRRPREGVASTRDIPFVWGEPILPTTEIPFAPGNWHFSAGDVSFAIDGQPRGPTGTATKALGVALRCDECDWRLTDDRRARWTFADYPIVDQVEAGSPAFRIGLRRGDTLRAINGLSLATRAGGDRLSTIGPGDSIRLEWRRRGSRYAASFILEGSPQRAERERVEVPLLRAPGEPFRAVVTPPLPPPNTIQLSQSVGTARVEVRGPGASWTRDSRTGELRIRVDSVTIIVRPQNQPPARRPPR